MPLVPPVMNPAFATAMEFPNRAMSPEMVPELEFVTLTMAPETPNVPEFAGPLVMVPLLLMAPVRSPRVWMPMRFAPWAKGASGMPSPLTLSEGV